MKVDYHIEGMTCDSCAKRIERVMLKKNGIQSVAVNFASENATIDYDPLLINPEQVREWINAIGFSAHDPKANIEQKMSRLDKLRIITMNLCALPFLPMTFFMPFVDNHHSIMPPVWVQFVLASVVQSFVAYPVVQKAFKGLKNKSVGMEAQIAFATTVIYLYSACVFFFRLNSEVYFEASVMIIFFSTIGKIIEHRYKKDNLNLTHEIANLIPQTVEDVNGNIRALHELSVGDEIKVKIGEEIAGDGVLISGAIECNEAHLSGESALIHKNIDDEVLAGALVVEGSGCYRLTRLGEDSKLGEMIASLNQAQGTKAPIARVADKIARIFIPSVLSIALLTFLLNYWLLGDLGIAIVRSAAVLAIACPCAMALATPASIMVGMGRALREGLYFKNATTLEETASLTHIIFDKTGTLTLGRPQICAYWQAEDERANKALSIALSIEAHATHPIAHAICDFAQQKGASTFAVSNISNQLGDGISASVADLGHYRLARLTALPEGLSDNAKWQEATWVGLYQEDLLLAAFALKDEARPEAKAVVEAIQAQNIAVMIVSGDRATVAQEMAHTLGITKVYAEQTPAQKQSIITALQQEGAKVAMVGDGLNDSPALAQADVSFALASASALSSSVANVSLLQENINALALAPKIAHLVVRNIQQNLFFAFIYNVLMIPLAACGVLSPAMAALAMALSSFSVITNALRLKSVKI